MQFQARLSLVSGKASKSVDDPNVVSIKLEPLFVADPAWLFEHLGQFLVVEVSIAPPARTPLEQAIEGF
jgi:hypothetical protein